MKQFEIVGLAGALFAAGLVAVACLRRGSWGVLVPMGEGGGFPFVLFWGGAGIWLIATIMGVRAGRWTAPALGGILVMGAAAPSLLLLGACLRGNCL